MIPNIVKGRGVTGALAYCMGQGNDPQTGERLVKGEGEKARASILGGQNFGFEIDSEERLDLARRIMEWQALPENQASKTRKLDRDCFHASLSWGEGQKPDREEMLQAAGAFLKAVGLEKAQAVFVVHDDTDHAHLHIVASRIDPETGKSLTLDNDYIAGQRWAARWEKEHGQERAGGPWLHDLRAAIARRDVGGVLEHLTAQKSTFQEWELNRALAYGDLEAKDRAAFKGDVLGHAHVIGLRETADDPISRYTTRKVLAAEMGLQRDAAALAQDNHRGLKREAIGKAEAEFTLKPEQAEALRHLTDERGFAMLWGEAGTGKSRTLNAARAAYEGAGRDVIGLSWTNDVVQQMHSDGFANCGTVASQLYAHDKGRAGWNKNTVLIVDEAAMLSTDSLARLTAAARQSGTKLILAGDDAQLSSIDRGGMFETLRESHGAAVLRDVQRVKDADQQAAFNDMHGANYLKALQTFEKRGGLHWTAKPSEALRQMAEGYAEAVATDPGKTRFMFAYSNADVAKLNSQARAIHKARGELGADHRIMTKDGLAEFAQGDRIQFTGNGYGQSQKRAGLVNGRVGTVEAIEAVQDGKTRLTVALDAAKGAEPKRVSFTVGGDAKGEDFNAFKHGYAGTVYRGQGKTLDESYVAHDPRMRSAAAYVALTRHRENVHIYAARENVKDLEGMAAGFARGDNKRAATAYHIDTTQLAGLDREMEAARGPDRRAEAANPRPATAAERAEAQAEAEETAHAHEMKSITGAKAFGLAAKALDAIFALLTGATLRAPQPKTAAERQAERAQALSQRETEQRRSRFLHDYGVDVPDERKADVEREKGRGRERDRGGGDSL